MRVVEEGARVTRLRDAQRLYDGLLLTRNTQICQRNLIEMPSVQKSRRMQLRQKLFRRANLWLCLFLLADGAALLFLVAVEVGTVSRTLTQLCRRAQRPHRLAASLDAIHRALSHRRYHGLPKCTAAR